MSLVIGENVSHAFGAREVLKNVSFHVGETDRIGLVGPNGEGKTTLLRITGGMLDPALGQVHRQRGLRIGYLPQEPPALEGTTIHGAALEVFADLRRTEQELQALAARLAESRDEPGLLKKYGAMQADFESRGGYRYAVRVEQVLTGLAFPRDAWDQPLAHLSGGQRTRAYLATLLLKEPDLLMLDEPTNHLDLDSIEWLEEWLAAFRGACVVVSHDRYLLDRVTVSTWELAFGALESYPAPYSRYLVLRAERHLERERAWEAQQEFIAKTEEYIRRNIYANRTGVARGRRTRLEKLQEEALDRPREQQAMHLALEARGRTGDVVLVAEDLAVGYDPAHTLLSVERLEVFRGDRVAILGANGIGKTTLLRTLLGELPPLAGRVRHGANVSIGYVSQTHAELNTQITALDAVLEAGGTDLTPERGRNLLGSLLLSGDDALKPIGQLSGGQQSRVCLARLVVQGVNVLVLDEPTNHLDIPSTEVVQEVLKRWAGAVVFVSHDRYLVQAVATHIWAIDGREVRCILGGWEAYIAWRAERRAAETGAAGAADEKAARKAAYEQRKAEERVVRRRVAQLERLKRRHEELEAEIQAVEEELARRMQEISAAGEAGDLERVKTLGIEYQDRQAHLKRLWDEWEQVGAKLE